MHTTRAPLLSSCAWRVPGPRIYLWWPYCIHIKLSICVALKCQHVWHMSVKCKIINPDGLLLDSSISSAFATGMLQSCTSPSTWCMDSGHVPDWHRATVYVYDDLMYTHEFNHLSGIDMAIGIIYEWHMQGYISWWLGAGLRYLQCISNGNASVLHGAISIVRAVAWCLTGARLLSMVYDDCMLAMWVELKCYNGIEMLQWYN